MAAFQEDFFDQITNVHFGGGVYLAIMDSALGLDISPSKDVEFVESFSVSLAPELNVGFTVFKIASLSTTWQRIATVGVRGNRFMAAFLPLTGGALNNLGSLADDAYGNPFFGDQSPPQPYTLNYLWLTNVFAQTGNYSLFASRRPAASKKSAIPQMYINGPSTDFLDGDGNVIAHTTGYTICGYRPTKDGNFTGVPFSWRSSHITVYVDGSGVFIEGLPFGTKPPLLP